MDKGRIAAKGSFSDLKNNEALLNLLKINQLNKGEQETPIQKTIEEEISYQEKL